MNIRILPTTTVNRIAAGEVIERPASAVKELVENSIDAGATRLDIEIEQGGRNLILVQDNGSGMNPEDLNLSVERHATSKLNTDNLLEIHSFGFRGEALPSIGSVSRMTISSRAKNSEEAWSVTVTGGEKSPLMPTSIKEGTRVEIRDLFFATPARLKFLKTEKTEQQHIISAVQQIAMVYPQISFSLISDGRKIFQYEQITDEDKRKARLKRLEAIIGKDFAENSIFIDATRDSSHLEGFAGLPTFNRGTSTAQYIFVNNRPIKDKLAYGAIRGAYQDFLARDRHPVVVLFLEVPSEEVDVNVHPAKAEVRFRDSGNVRGLIVGAIKNALASAGHRASSTISQSALGSFSNQSQSAANIQYLGRPVANYSTFYDGGKNTFRAFGQSLNLGNKTATNQIPMEINDEPSAKSDQFTESYIAEDFSQNKYPLGVARCQIHETYIVAQTKDGLVIVDQHAAHERLVYERMKNAIEKEGIKTQKLLIPEVVELSEDAVENLLKRSKEFSELGLVFEKFSDKAIIVKETPSILGDLDIINLVKDLADDLLEFGEALSLKEKLEHVCGTIACHGSVRSGRILNTQEMNYLLRDMEATPHSGQCNHGRPTYVELKLSEIEKLFGRK